MIIGVTGVGKARGVTTVATGLATAFGQTVGNSVVVEADPTGGDLAAWRGLRLDDAGVLKFASQVGAARDREVAAEEQANLVESNVMRAAALPRCSVATVCGAGARCWRGTVGSAGRSNVDYWWPRRASAVARSGGGGSRPLGFAFGGRHLGHG